MLKTIFSIPADEVESIADLLGIINEHLEINFDRTDHQIDQYGINLDSFTIEIVRPHENGNQDDVYNIRATYKGHETKGDKKG